MDPMYGRIRRTSKPGRKSAWPFLARKSFNEIMPGQKAARRTIRLNLSGIQTWHRFKSGAHNKLLQTANLIIILPIWSFFQGRPSSYLTLCVHGTAGQFKICYFLRLRKVNMHNLRGGGGLNKRCYCGEKGQREQLG